VLAVEDQVDMLESLRRMLEEHGAIVTPVTSGDAALEILRDQAGDFDVLISDLGMPRMDGYELIRRVRNELGLDPQRLPAVALTAYAREEDRNRALQAGFQGHLSKPYHVGQLVAVLNQLRTTPGSDEHGPRKEAGASVAY
jgi:CheY-like chemotaxis protein